MDRIYLSLIKNHLKNYSQMVFLTGPRQVGKTTIAEMIHSENSGIILNWDLVEDREKILRGPEYIMSLHASPSLGSPSLPITIFDEIHKFKDWKNFIKGFFDRYKKETKIIVTGSSRLDIYYQGGDSLMGRYFLYTVHPLSIAECANSSFENNLIQMPKKISDHELTKLWEFGGFPDPYLQQDKNFFNLWQRTRHQQLFRDDILDLSKVSDMAQLEVLAKIIGDQAGQLVNYSNLASKVRVSDQTVRRWIDILDSVFFCFRIKPWHKNVTRSLIKEPKIFLWDWSLLTDVGSRFENFIASHLLKACSFWSEKGLGTFELFFLRDKEKREVDFIVVRDEIPWFIVEAKTSKKSLSPELEYFQKQTKASHAFQVTKDLPFVEVDTFSSHKPIRVPYSTLLSQLI